MIEYTTLKKEERGNDKTHLCLIIGSHSFHCRTTSFRLTYLVTYLYGQGEHEAIHYGLWMTYPTYSAGSGACDKQMQGLNYTFDRFVQRKVHLFC